MGRPILMHFLNLMRKLGMQENSLSDMILLTQVGIHQNWAKLHLFQTSLCLDVGKIIGFGWQAVKQVGSIPVEYLHWWDGSQPAWQLHGQDSNNIWTLTCKDQIDDEDVDIFPTSPLIIWTNQLWSPTGIVYLSPSPMFHGFNLGSFMLCILLYLLLFLHCSSRCFLQWHQQMKDGICPKNTCIWI